MTATRRIFLKSAAGAGISLAVPWGVIGEEVSLMQTGGNNNADWLNPPKRWKLEGGSLICTADAKTDFWRKTFYGYITDNGHFYYRRVSGDFTTVLKVSGQYHALYDQAGLMVRIDAQNWMKCGVEFVDGHQNMSIVYTREFSSWVTGRLPAGTSSLWLKVVRKGPALDIFHSLDGRTFMESGVGYLGTPESAMVGPMCAAPEGNGFEVRFDDWEITPGG